MRVNIQVVKTIATVTATCRRCSRARSARRCRDLARALRVIADPARLRILSLIQAQPEGEACVCHLTEPLGLTQPTVSHHLKVLLDAGLVEREQRGAGPTSASSASSSPRCASCSHSSTAQQQPELVAGWITGSPLAAGSCVFTALTIAPCIPSATWWVNSTETSSNPAASRPASYSPLESAPAMHPT